MSEVDAINKTRGLPATVDSLEADLNRLGITPGTVLLVHSSLSSLGWVCGGPVAVVLALESVLGSEGTLVMPSHTGDVSEPSHWKNPPVPESWWKTIRESMPAYDSNFTPTRGMGAIAEGFRGREGVLRSSHPSESFAARGPKADAVVDNHSLDFPTGDQSPLARIYDLDGTVLLLGVDYLNATSLHLAEYRANYPGKKTKQRGAPITVEDKRNWVQFQDFEWDDSDFNLIGKDFADSTGLVKSGPIGSGHGLLMPQRQLVDYAQGWIEKNRR
ncbi:MAG: AAC(3) family N-acetyltransferase [Candidatus Thermoplasmatota archaeon]|nr:AAC(3) family N-acetyltransferase [Candidatus Thermoplasmatota archaeon]